MNIFLPPAMLILFIAIGLPPYIRRLSECASPNDYILSNQTFESWVKRKIKEVGRQKRIVLCDTLLNNFNEDEIESVMGHELGHHKMRHIWKLILSGGVATIAVFFAANAIFLDIRGITGYATLRNFESLVMIYAIISLLNILILPISRRLSIAESFK